MNSRTMNILWGIVLVAAGGLFLADNLGLIPLVPPLLWAMVFAGASALFSASYLVSGLHRWGLLFRATITAAIATTLFLSWLGLGGSFIATMFLWAIGLPFFVGFALDYPHSWPLAIPGYALMAIGGLVLLAGRLPGGLFAALVLLAIALPFAVAFLLDREKWWALIPAGVLSAVAMVMLLVATFGSLLVALWPLALLALGGWLVLTGLRSRQPRWEGPIDAPPQPGRQLVPVEAAFSGPAAPVNGTGKHSLDTAVPVAPGP